MSQINVFFIPNRNSDEFQNELNLFLRSHKVLTIQKHALDDGWSFCVEWLENASDLNISKNKNSNKINYERELSKEEFFIYNKLSALRKEIAKELGVPPYNIAYNSQIADMAKLKSPSIDEINKIDGIGKSFMENYAERFLSVLNDIKNIDDSIVDDHPANE